MNLTGILQRKSYFSQCANLVTIGVYFYNTSFWLTRNDAPAHSNP